MKRVFREAISWNAHPGQEAYVAGFLAARDEIVECYQRRDPQARRGRILMLSDQKFDLRAYLSVLNRELLRLHEYMRSDYALEKEKEWIMKRIEALQNILIQLGTFHVFIPEDKEDKP